MSMLGLYIGLHVVLFIWVLINQRFMPRLPTTYSLVTEPKVSILVPLRNEEHHVPALIQNFVGLSYSNLQFIFLDDGSTDQTKSLLTHEIQQLHHAKILDGKKLPPDWIGKNHACHQLSQHATGDYLLFLDADVRLKPHTIEASLKQLNQKSSGFLSGFPTFPVRGMMASLVVPLQHVFIYLHLPLMLANNSKNPQAAAAHGSFMLFNAKVYKDIGGHEKVKSSIVEDVQLAKLVKQSGYRICLANVTRYVLCDMYQTNKEVWLGFSKNAFPGIGKSWLLAAGVLLFYSLVFILPLFLLAFSFSVHWSYCLPYLMSVAVKFYIDRMANQKLWLCFFIPFSAIAVLAILIRSILLSATKTGYTWKGRTYS